MPSKHTEGPWMTHVEPSGDVSICQRADDGTCGPQIASVMAENCDTEEQVMADAVLIAAAPELLAACRAAHCWLREFHVQAGSPIDDDGLFGLFDQLEQATKKAKEGSV